MEQDRADTTFPATHYDTGGVRIDAGRNSPHLAALWVGEMGSLEKVEGAAF